MSTNRLRCWDDAKEKVLRKEFCSVRCSIAIRTLKRVKQQTEMRELTEINGCVPGLLVYWFVVFVYVRERPLARRLPSEEVF
jgi:hypothetical protein